MAPVGRKKGGCKPTPPGREWRGVGEGIWGPLSWVGAGERRTVLGPGLAVGTVAGGGDRRGLSKCANERLAPIGNYREQ